MSRSTQASKNAVHGIIFRGIPQNEVGCVSQPPLAQTSKCTGKES